MKKHLSDYQYASLPDLINDESFILWISQRTEELDNKWNNIQQVYPTIIPQIQEAREIVLSMHFKTEVFDKNEQEELWNIIAGKTTLGSKPGKQVRLWYSYAAAAVLAGILLSVSIFYANFRKVVIRTPYGQLQTVTLPDSSVVTLNANSSIKFDRNWNNNEIREVWIEGEAFLKVSHLHQNGLVTDHQRFVVHTGALNVEVLGTSFNVNDRRGRTEVALLEGRIQLDLRGDARQRSLILAPGDIVEYAGARLNKKPVNVKEYTSWKEGKLYFRDTPLSKIFNYIEDIYGYRVLVDDPKVLSRRLSGTINSKSEKVLVEAIARTLNLNITIDNASHTLIVKSN